MSDKAKVIKGLRCHVYGHPHTRCFGCPYWGTGKHGLSECSVLAADALSLLEEQNAKDNNIPAKWISVKDRLPEIRHAVLGYAPFYKNIWAVTMHEDGCWYFWYPGTSKYDPDWYGPITHWMPLPELPKEGDSE